MIGKERPIFVAVITTMGVIIAALITSGYWSRTDAQKRESTLEARVKSLEQELGKDLGSPSTHAVSPSGVRSAERSRAETAERELALLRKRVEGLDACPEAMFLGKLVRIGYQPAYASVAEDLGQTLRAAGATVEASEFTAQEAAEAVAKFGTIYYRDGELASKAHAMSRLVRSKYQAQVKQGNWVYADSDFAIWIGSKAAAN
jgi:hypothetical protein